MLQQWAAVISKFSSDCVGGIVESMADRGVYLRSRLGDFKRKQQDLFKLITDLELIDPEKELDQLLSGNRFLEGQGAKESALLDRARLNVLDLMYIWMRQPRAPGVFTQMLEKSSVEERRLFGALRRLLSGEKEMMQLLESGIFGSGTPRVVHFYRRAWKLYFEETSSLTKD